MRGEDRRGSADVPNDRQGGCFMYVRKYRQSDLAEVTAIADAAWRPIRKMSREALGDAVSDILNPLGDDVSKGLQVKAQIESGKYGVAVCEHEGRIVGFVTWTSEGPVGEICNNAAMPESGLKGVGQAMYRFVLDLFREQGIRVVKVTTGLDPAHAPARRAYERAGFCRHLDSTTYYMELK